MVTDWQIASTEMGLTTICNSSSRGSKALFWPLGTVHVVNTYMKMKQSEKILNICQAVVANPFNPSIFVTFRQVLMNSKVISVVHVTCFKWLN